MKEKHNKTLLVVCAHGDTLTNFRLDFLKSFQKYNYSIFTIAPEISSSELEKLHQNNISFIELSFERKGSNPSEIIKSCFNLYKKTKEINPDLIFSYNHKAVVIASVAGYFANVKNLYCMITGRGHIFDDNRLKHRLRRFLAVIVLKLSLTQNRKVFFQNSDDVELFKSYKLVNDTQISIVNGSGVNLDFYKESPLPEGLVFLTAARLLKSKGLFEFAKAFKEFSKNYPDSKAYVVGSEDKHDDSISLDEIKEWKNKYGVEYLGFYEDIRQAIDLCSVFVLLSYNEGTPRSVLEAMSMGRPILTTNTSGCRETVLSGVNGFLAEVKNIQDSQSKMEEFVNRDIRSKLGKESKRICLEKYDVHKVNKILLDEMKVL